MTDSAINNEFRSAILIFAATCVAYLKLLRRRSSSEDVDIHGAGAEDWEEEEESVYSLNNKFSFQERRSSYSRDSFANLCLEGRSTHTNEQDLNTPQDFHNHFENPEDDLQPMDGFRGVSPKKFHSTSDLSLVFSSGKEMEKNYCIMPKRLIMIRHGQSEGNVNEKIYSVKPDNALRLTGLGWEQARMAGQTLKNEIIGKDEPIHFILSPYVRTAETLHGLLSAWSDPDEEFSHIMDEEVRKRAWYDCLHSKHKISWHEDPRIREQDFGNYQNPDAINQAKKERMRFGAFYYRFPNGESASDVYDRVSTFLDSLWRSFFSHRHTNYVIVTHGISIRVLLSRYFRYTIDQFHTLANPKNCEMVILGHDGLGKLQLKGRCELVMKKKDVEEKQEKNENLIEYSNSQTSLDYDHKESILCPTVRKSTLRSILFSPPKKVDFEVDGFTFYDKLRTLPPEYITKRQSRISFPKK